MKNKISLENKTILITGAAGFIGANLVTALLKRGEPVRVVGIDNLNDYYDPALKDHRLARIGETAREHPAATWVFQKADIADRAAVDAVFSEYEPDIVVNLAAQAGVRYSIDHPDNYIQSNIIGFYNIIEAFRTLYARDNGHALHLVYASSSSVYGENKQIPFRVEDPVEHPVSLYAATKKSNELIAYSYSKLYGLPVTGLRFFTVYGPAGRPDMAYFSFAEKLRQGKTIEIFNYGNCKRDFTYVDDIVEGVARVMCSAPVPGADEEGLPVPPYALYNIGNASPENLMDFVSILKDALVKEGVLDPSFDLERHMELVPMQKGDVPVTYADVSALERDFGFRPATPLAEGLHRFAKWYAKYYNNER